MSDDFVYVGTPLEAVAVKPQQQQQRGGGAERRDNVDGRRRIDDASSSNPNPASTSLPVAEQVGRIMNQVCPAGNGWTQATGGNIPPDKSVVVNQEGAVERRHGDGIGEINRVTATRVRLHESRQRRATLREPREVIPLPMLVARMAQDLIGNSTKNTVCVSGVETNCVRPCRNLSVSSFTL